MEASRRFFSGFGTLSTGVMSPTRSSAMSWMRLILIHLLRSSFSRRVGGANMDIIDIRYMWSAMDSPLPRQLETCWWLTAAGTAHLSIAKRLHPSLFVVFNRSSMWKNGIGDSASVGGWSGIASNALSTVHGSDTLIVGVYPRSKDRQKRQYTAWPVEAVGKIGMVLRERLASPFVFCSGDEPIAAWGSGRGQGFA